MAIILGIGGSPRAHGNSASLLKAALDTARAEGVATRMVFLREYSFSSCIGCERCRKDKICTGLKDGMNLLYPWILEASGLILASPTHNYNITALMKAFIDRLYCFYDFTDDHPRVYTSRLAGQGRKAAVIGVCEQTDLREMGATMEMLRMPIEPLGYEVIDELPVIGMFERGKVRSTSAIDDARSMGLKMAQAIGV